MSCLEIKFNRSERKFIAGDVISGKLIIKTRAPIEVTGLRVSMLMHCKIKVLSGAERNPYYEERTIKLMVDELKSKVITTGFRIQSVRIQYICFPQFPIIQAVLPIGTHSIPFSFAPLFNDCSESFEKGETFCRYFLKAEVISEKNKTISQEGFQVDSLKLDDIPAALNWQSKSDSKNFTSPLQKLVVTIAAPTAIGRKEHVPFHISLRNDYKNSKTIIRAKLIQTRKYTFKKTRQTENEILNKSVQEIDSSYQEFNHILKVHTDSFTFQCPIMSATYRIFVEVTAAMDTVMKFDFPVLVGEWKGEPIRKSHVFRGAGEQVTNIERPIGVPNLSSTTASVSDPLVISPVISPPYVERLEPPPTYEEAVQSPPPLPPKSSPLNESEFFFTAKALYSFKAAHPSEISFEGGQVITNVHESDEDGWLVGTIGRRTGLIPGRYVEPIPDDNST